MKRVETKEKCAGRETERKMTDAVPRDDDALRAELLRRVMDIRQAWRVCNKPLCKRTRRCAGADFSCAERLPKRELTKEQEARARHALHRGLQRRMKEIEREKGVCT